MTGREEITACAVLFVGDPRGIRWCAGYLSLLKMLNLDNSIVFYHKVTNISLYIFSCEPFPFPYQVVEYALQCLLTVVWVMPNYRHQHRLSAIANLKCWYRPKKSLTGRAAAYSLHTRTVSCNPSHQNDLNSDCVNFRSASFEGKFF